MSLPAGRAHQPLAVDGNGELHDSAAIESAPTSLVAPLRCADCGAPLEAVRAHPRRERAGIVHVAAHYRLAPGFAHTTTCPWLALPTSSAPAARPAPAPKAAPRMYSLVVPGRASIQSPVWRSRSFRHERLPPLNSAAKVADLLLRHDDNSETVRLDYLGQPLSWRDFLFPCADAERLARLLHEARPGHPVAVVGRLSAPVVARTGRTHCAVFTDAFVSTADRPRGPRIILRTANRQLIEHDGTDQPVIALGWCQVHRPTGPGHVDQDIVMWINRSWQISPLRPCSGSHVAGA